VNVLISGAHGLIGAACVDELRGAGHRVETLSRVMGQGLPWDVTNGRVNLRDFEPDALIHLAGASVAVPWTEKSKKVIWSSRVDATKKLCEFLASKPNPPKILLSGSAIGFYGPRRDKLIIESSPASSDFLGELCAQWEAATKPLAATGCRVIHLRTGIVLSAQGGALGKMLPFFKFGLGGPLGDGTHWMSWISLEDEVRAIQFLLANSNVSGPVNLVAPNPVTNREFAQTLGMVLRRPAFLPTPAAFLRMIYGDFVDAALLSSQRVQPQTLQALGFEWRHPELEGALRAVLQK
jgi:uncharacterized protein